MALNDIQVPLPHFTDKGSDVKGGERFVQEHTSSEW